jgi:hypothetical protein
MVAELDWMEREERYRKRVTRLLLGAGVVTAVVLGVLIHAASTREKATRKATAEAAQAARLADAKRQRDAFVADSSAAANRFTDFQHRHTAEPLSGTPFLQVPLPHGAAVSNFVNQIWPEYARIVDPKATDAQMRDWYKGNFIDVMTEGPLRPKAILLPEIEQRGLEMSFVKVNFTQIVAAQQMTGMREAAESAADSARALGVPPIGGTPASAGDTSEQPASGTHPESTPPTATTPTTPPSETPRAAPPASTPAAPAPATPTPEPSAPAGATSPPATPSTPPATPPTPAAPSPSPAPTDSVKPR